MTVSTPQFSHNYTSFRKIKIHGRVWSALRLGPWCSLQSCPRFIPQFNPIRPTTSTTSSREFLTTGTYKNPFPTLTTLEIFDSTPSDDQSAAMNKTTPSPSPVPKASPSSNPPPSPTAGTKRKRNTPAKYYAVKAGHKPGIYYGWNDCLAQVTGFKGAICECTRRSGSSNRCANLTRH